MAGRTIAPGAPIKAPQKVAAAAPPAGAGQKDEEFYTGSILYQPYSGRLCRQHLFDNVTGRMSDNGVVDCEQAAYRSANGPAMNWSVARTNVISYSFRRH